MAPKDVAMYVEELQGLGLVYLRSGEAVDIAVVDQQQGPMATCRWIEWGKVSIEPGWISACWRKGSKPGEVATPEGWRYEGSLSQEFDFVPSEEVRESLRFVRHERGVDVFQNLLSGKEVYVGRAIRKC
jgi:hypothetical protein